MNACIPCPPLVRHAARAVRHHVVHPVHNVGRHIARHPGRLAVLVCCAGTVGPMMGDSLNGPNARETPSAVGQMGDSLAWPDLPGWSVAGSIGGPGAITGGGVVQIPVYRTAPAPQFLSTQPNVYSTPRAPRMTSVPEPSAFALLLLPAVGMAMVRRARA